MTVAVNRGQHVRTAGQPMTSSTYVAPHLLARTSLLKPFITCRRLRSSQPQGCAQRLSATQGPEAAASSEYTLRKEPEPTSRRRLLLAGNALLLAAACPCCRQVAQASEGGFAYEGDAGPTSWPGTCTIGDKQSPINIPIAEHFAQRGTNSEPRPDRIGEIKFMFEQTLSTGEHIKFNFEHEVDSSGDVNFNFEQKLEKGGALKLQYMQEFGQQQVDRLGPIKFQYNKQAEATVQNTGHGTMQVNPAKGNMMQVGGKNLELVQWHFHTPSEHAFDGVRKSMEVHLVHKDTLTGQLYVVGALLQEGPAPPNPAVQFALKLAPPTAGPQQSAGQQSMQLSALLPPAEKNGHRPYVHYVGSLTTPPCSEEVQWLIFAHTVTIPGSQVDQFQQFADKANPGLRANARPLQPLNGRDIDYIEFL